MPTEKLKLEDILGPREKNVTLPTRDEKHLKDHKTYRSPRDRMLVRATPQDRKLSGDPAEDMRRHEVAREFINNGMDHHKAYMSVYGNSKGARGRAWKMFQSPWMRQLVLKMLQGTEDQEEIPKQYAIDKLVGQIEANILDYMADDGTWLNVEELKRLPRFAQEQIKKLNVTTIVRPVIERDADGNEIGRHEIREQHVQIELWDKQKALDTLSKAMKWIEEKGGDINLYMGDVMIEAEERIETMKEKSIEGASKRVTSD